MLLRLEISKSPRMGGIEDVLSKMVVSGKRLTFKVLSSGVDVSRRRVAGTETVVVSYSLRLNSWSGRFTTIDSSVKERVFLLILNSLSKRFHRGNIVPVCPTGV